MGSLKIPIKTNGISGEIPTGGVAAGYSCSHLSKFEIVEPVTTQVPLYMNPETLTTLS